MVGQLMMTPKDPTSVNESDEPDAPEVDDEPSRPRLGERYTSDFTPAAITVGPDGAPVAHNLHPTPTPEATPENWICLRGPCRHYMHFVVPAAIMNPAGTFERGKEPKERYDYCDAIPGDPIDMSESVVYTCNRWDPQDEDDAATMARERRRTKFLAVHQQYVGWETKTTPVTDDIDDVVAGLDEPSDPVLEEAAQGTFDAKAKQVAGLAEVQNSEARVAIDKLRGTICHPPSSAPAGGHAVLSVKCKRCGAVTYHPPDVDTETMLQILECGIPTIPGSPSMPAVRADTAPLHEEPSDVVSQEPAGGREGESQASPRDEGLPSER